MAGVENLLLGNRMLLDPFLCHRVPDRLLLLLADDLYDPVLVLPQRSLGATVSRRQGRVPAKVDGGGAHKTSDRRPADDCGRNITGPGGFYDLRLGELPVFIHLAFADDGQSFRCGANRHDSRSNHAGDANAGEYLRTVPFGRRPYTLNRIDKHLLIHQKTISFQIIALIVSAVSIAIWKILLIFGVPAK